MELMMLIVAWGNREDHTMYMVQTMPLACWDYGDTIEMFSKQPLSGYGYGETVACVIPEVRCVNQTPF